MRMISMGQGVVAVIMGLVGMLLLLVVAVMLHGMAARHQGSWVGSHHSRNLCPCQSLTKPEDD